MSIEIRPTIGTLLPRINASPRFDMTTPYPSPYPTGMVAIRVGLLVTYVLPYPILYPAGKSLRITTVVLKVITGIK